MNMIQALSNWIIENISLFGYSAVVFLMALESANIPVPSEVVLPFAGFLVFRGQLNFHLAALAGAVGCLLGSVASYYLGKKLGRLFVQKYGKWFFIGPKQFELGDRWMKKYGNFTAFFSRLLPVVRTFISLVMGILEAPFFPFAILTFVGSWIWSYLLVYLGYALGEHWETLHPLWQKFDVAIVSLAVIGIGFYIFHHIKNYAKK